MNKVAWVEGCTEGLPVMGAQEMMNLLKSDLTMAKKKKNRRAKDWTLEIPGVARWRWAPAINCPYGAVVRDSTISKVAFFIPRLSWIQFLREVGVE